MFSNELRGETGAVNRPCGGGVCVPRQTAVQLYPYKLRKPSKAAGKRQVAQRTGSG